MKQRFIPQMHNGASMSGDDITRDSRGRFRPGKPGGPGRPFGSLTRVSAPLAFFHDVVADWEEHGKAAITHLSLTDPVRYFLLMLAIETGEFRVRRRRRSCATESMTDRDLSGKS